MRPRKLHWKREAKRTIRLPNLRSLHGFQFCNLHVAFIKFRGLREHLKLRSVCLCTSSCRPEFTSSVRPLTCSKPNSNSRWLNSICDTWNLKTHIQATSPTGGSPGSWIQEASGKLEEPASDSAQQLNTSLVPHIVQNLFKSVWITLWTPWKPLVAL